MERAKITACARLIVDEILNKMEVSKKLRQKYTCDCDIIAVDALVNLLKDTP